ncbi:comta [Symbiodinium sp. CCMP2592]|nr:comta [Symbiodinium sp. CCMP2592]
MSYNVNVKGTVSMSDGKVSLVLEHDAPQDKISNGTIMVHESRQPLTDRTLSTMICHAQEKQKFHATGSFGMWNESAEKALVTALLRGKRTSKQSTSTSIKAIEDAKVGHKAIEDIKVNHKATENIEVTDGSAETSVKHEKDPTNEKHPTSDKHSSDDSSSDDESSGSSSGSSTDPLPEYTKWSSDWHDIYAEVLMLAEERAQYLHMQWHTMIFPQDVHCDAILIGSESITDIDSILKICNRCRTNVRHNMMFLRGEEINTMTYNEMASSGVLFVISRTAFAMDYLLMTFRHTARNPGDPILVRKIDPRSGYPGAGATSAMLQALDKCSVYQARMEIHRFKHVFFVVRRNCAWAFACVEFQDPGLVAALAHACKGGKLWTFAPDEFCAIAWAFGKFRMADAEIRADLLVISRQRCDELDNVSFVNLATSLLTMVESGGTNGSDKSWQESVRPLVEQLEASLAKREDLTPQQMAATCRSLCRAGFPQEANRIAEGSTEPDVLAALLAAAERAGDAPRCVELWSRLASTMPALALRAAALFCAARWTRDANLSDGRRLIDELSSLPEPFSALGELLGGTPTATMRAGGEVNGAAHTEGYGEFAELGGLLGAALRSGSPGNPALSLGAVESFASSCRHLNAFLGPRAAILDEFTARLPQLVVEIGGGCGAWAAHLAARVQEYGGRVVSIESDPVYMAVSRCIAHYAGLSSSLQLLLGESSDCLPQLLEARGPSSVDVLVLRGNREGQYLCELRRVEDMGLFTSGCVVADHMLQFGSPQFLADMARSPKYSLDLVEVDTVGGGTDWVALCAVRARLQDDPRAERELPLGLASLRAAAEQAWRRQRDGGDVSHPGFAAPERFRERLMDFARNLGLQPSQRFRGIAPAPLPERSKEAVHQFSSQTGLPPTEISLPQQEIRSDAKAPAPEPGMGAASRSPVAQQYVLALDLKRWLNAVDPTGGCLHYLAAVQERHETSDHLTKAYVHESAGRCMLKAEFFSDLAISAEHRPRFLRWFTDSCGVEGVLGAEASDAEAEAPALPCSQAAAREDAVVDLRHLSFSDWLASMDPGMALQRYLPVIQESYDTVSQITTTYTTANTAESDLKCLDEQIFEDFGIEEGEHRALFRSWFVRFCGVRPADSEEDPATPHFGPEGEEGKEPGTADQSPDAASAPQEEPKKVGETPGTAFQAPTGPGGHARGSGGFFDFEDLPESSPTSTAQLEFREAEDVSTASAGTKGVVENVQQQDSSGMFDFDQLDSSQGLTDNSASWDPDVKAEEVVPAAADSVPQVAHHLRPSAQPYIASRLRQAPRDAAAASDEGREEARAAIEILARGMGKMRQAGALSRLRGFRLKEAPHAADASAAEDQQEVAHHLRPSAQPYIASRLRRSVADAPVPMETRAVQVEAPQDVVAAQLGQEDGSQDSVAAVEPGENEATEDDATEAKGGDEQEVKPSGGGFFDFDDLDEAGG